MRFYHFAIVVALISLSVSFSLAQSTLKTNDMSNKSSTKNRVPKPGSVIIEDGYLTEEIDKGRPVRLIAAALKVTPEVFRDAFSNVRPERGGGKPSPTRARENKSVLLAALGKYRVTNERLDEVSDFYRYRPGTDELWKHKPAVIEAIIVDNQVIELKIVQPGAGYSSEPNITIVGYENVKVKSTLEFTTDLKTNGRIASLTIEKPTK
jgi:hypothetical protein